MDMSDWDPTVPLSLIQYIRIISRILKLVRKHKIQQIHCTKVLSEGFAAWCVKHIVHIPYLLYAHGEEITTGLVSRKFQWLIPRIYNGASVIIANSANTKAILESINVTPDKIHMLHPGVSADVFDVNTEDANRIKNKHQIENCPILLTVGRMQKRKGQDMVIRALPLIRKKFPKIKYLIVGGGKEYPFLQKLADEQKVAESVIFAGRVSDEDLPAYYAACDIFIMANREIDGDIEGFGMVFLEANAARKPVIGSLSGGAVEAVVHRVTGLSVDGTNVNAIADAVIFLLENPQKAKTMGETGRQRVENEFTWESVVQKTRLISEMIG
jgi:phosphatidylinositol alpha-1,6-mannosyltransferase